MQKGEPKKIKLGSGQWERGTDMTIENATFCILLIYQLR